MMGRFGITTCRSGLLAGAALLLVSFPAAALDGTPTPEYDPVPVQEAFRTGAKALKRGDMAEAQQALGFAASKGHVIAQWKLAQILAAGDGVPKNDAKAFELYKAIVESHAEDSPDSPEARIVSNALVALGSYYMVGIPENHLKPNVPKAAQLFQYAASYFGDSDAQYNLGRIYLKGSGDQARDPVMAARWLRLAANKGQREAQAVLGNLLFSGEGVQRQGAEGLMYLTLARDDGSGRGVEKWIIDLYDDAFAKATPEEREMCLTFLEQFVRDRS